MEKCDQAEMVFTAYITLKMEIVCMLSRLGKKHFAFHVKKPRKKQVNNL